MKSVLSWFVVIGLIGAAGSFGLIKYQDEGRQATYKQELAKLKSEYQTKGVGLQLLAKDKYNREIGIYLSQYFSRLKKLGKQYPEFYDIKREQKRTEELTTKGVLTPSKIKNRNERFNMSLELMDKMRSGEYRPIYTSSDKNFRFDIWNIEPVREGASGYLKVSYAHWGAWSNVQYDMIMGNIRAEQQEGKPVEVPQIVGDAQPPTLVFSPERWINEFVPGLQIGYYQLPLFPTQAQGLTLSFQYTLTTVGGSKLPVDIQFPEMEIPATWKIGEDKDWNAKERYASDEELEDLGVKPQVSVK